MIFCDLLNGYLVKFEMPIYKDNSLLRLLILEGAPKR